VYMSRGFVAFVIFFQSSIREMVNSEFICLWYTLDQTNLSLDEFQMLAFTISRAGTLTFAAAARWQIYFSNN
jgi:hypothetical protein